MGIRSLVISIVALLTVACGGGGGGGGTTTTDPPIEPRPAMTVTEVNSPTVSAVVLDGSDTIDSVGDQAPGLGLVSSEVTVAAGSAAPTPAEFALVQALRAPEYASLLTVGLSVEVVASESAVCDGGGTIKVTIDTAGGSLEDFLLGSIAPGATMMIVFDRCLDTSIGTLVDGSLKIVYTSVPPVIGEIGVDVFQMEIQFIFGDLLITGQGSVDGDMTTFVDSDGTGIYLVRVSGRVLEVISSVRHVALFGYLQTVSANGGTDVTSEFDYQLDDSLLDGSVTVVTLEPFVTNTAEMWPYMGKALITGANMTSVTVTALDSTNVLLDVDTDGNGTGDVQINKTWQELDDLVLNLF